MSYVVFMEIKDMAKLRKLSKTLTISKVNLTEDVRKRERATTLCCQCHASMLTWSLNGVLHTVFVSTILHGQQLDIKTSTMHIYTVRWYSEVTTMKTIETISFILHLGVYINQSFINKVLDKTV